jgi:hypothetical protein
MKKHKYSYCLIFFFRDVSTDKAAIFKLKTLSKENKHIIKKLRNIYKIHNVWWDQNSN